METLTEHWLPREANVLTFNSLLSVFQLLISYLVSCFFIDSEDFREVHRDQPQDFILVYYSSPLFGQPKSAILHPFFVIDVLEVESNSRSLLLQNHHGCINELLLGVKSSTQPAMFESRKGFDALKHDWSVEGELSLQNHHVQSITLLLNFHPGVFFSFKNWRMIVDALIIQFIL